eukprot:CAMPEP_0198134038 /NCGR_PEP_ID=MMETSP1442-20131203/59872_1 /TAXON_ID= /ORGANISM="Craspedostauros australis, Strain CCMP3328" /LENGTH=272 /DNA_ID=CAMNT_0043795173 /DNA_START=19 /DNA_END=838 /DNA_ORIENTATION=-
MSSYLHAVGIPSPPEARRGWKQGGGGASTATAIHTDVGLRTPRHESVKSTPTRSDSHPPQLQREGSASIWNNISMVSSLFLAASGGAGVLSTDSDAPPVTKTAVGADLLESLDVVTELGINVLGEDLAVLSGLEVLLSVQEPERDLELAWVLDDGDDLLDLIGGQFSCSLVDVDLGLFADEVSETASKTLDLGQSENDISLSFHVCIKNTQNVLEFRSLHQRARHGGSVFPVRQGSESAVRVRMVGVVLGLRSGSKHKARGWCDNGEPCSAC